MSSEDKRCASCNKGEAELINSLKFCAKCKNVQYCSRDCQKNNWKSHKKACAAAAGTATRPRFTIDKPFTALQNGSWLSSRPEQDVYQLLSDVFRMRREDQYRFEGEVDEGSVYAGGSTAQELQNYRRFLKRITKLDEERPASKNLLPSWWSAAKLEECVKVATTNKDAMVAYAVEKSDVQKFYKQNDMPMQLRMFGEALDGTKVMGQSGATMLQMRASLET